LLPPNKKSILFGMNDFPKHIGPYSVEAEIGRGGMGVVYRAVDSRLGRVIALKTFHQEAIAGPEGLDRFEREAQSLAALNHPNIATIHGLEQDGDQRYLVLEYVDGETLGDRLARGPLSVPEAIDVCTQIAAGLGAAHEAGVVHRDLKPANVKINTDGQVKVLDFGLALRDTPIKPVGSNDQTQLLSDMGPVTVAGTLLGTAPYMSPEQARGESVDRRSDIWAFGVILYECLTGSNPFSGPTMSDTIAAILTTEPDLTLLPPSTPPIVLHLLRRSLQRDLRSRLRDANDLRVLLEDCGLDGLGLPQLDSVGTAIINKSFDAEFATLRGVHVNRFYFLLLGMTALTVVLLVSVVGIILVIALLTLPAAMANLFASRLRSMMALATGLCLALTTGGLALSYGPDLPSGAVTILLTGLAFIGTAVLRRPR